MKFKNIIKHFILITHHKWVVFKLCCKVGEPWRGFWHDFSKYSPTEFLVGCRYYQGNRSPNNAEREATGYSKAWLHHKGRNRHHAEYWVDDRAPDSTPVIPYKYTVEMLCDKLAAGIIYEGKKWTKEYELEYWSKEKERIRLNQNTKNFLTEVLEQVAQNGINKTLTKKNIKYLYKKHCQ